MLEREHVDHRRDRLEALLADRRRGLLRRLRVIPLEQLGHGQHGGPHPGNNRFQAVSAASRTRSSGSFRAVQEHRQGPASRPRRPAPTPPPHGPDRPLRVVQRLDQCRSRVLGFSPPAPRAPRAASARALGSSPFKASTHFSTVPSRLRRPALRAGEKCGRQNEGEPQMIGLGAERWKCRLRVVIGRVQYAGRTMPCDRKGWSSQTSCPDMAGIGRWEWPQACDEAKTSRQVFCCESE